MIMNIPEYIQRYPKSVFSQQDTFTLESKEEELYYS